MVVVGGVVLNVFVNIFTRPQIDNMIASPTIPQMIEALCSFLLSESDSMINWTERNMIQITAIDISTYIATLPISINFRVKEFASVMTVVCAKASIGTKAIIKESNFFINSNYIYNF